MKVKKINTFTYYVVQILFLEVLYKYVTIKNVFGIGLLYTFVYSIPIALFLSFFTCLAKPKVNRYLHILVSSIITFYFGFQYIFYTLFSIPFSFRTIRLAHQAFDFTDIMGDVLKSHIGVILAILLPFVFLLCIQKWMDYRHHSKYQNLAIFILFCFGMFINVIYLLPNKAEYNSAYNLYKNTDDQIRLIDQFGLLTYTKIDISRIAFGYQIQLVDEEQVEKIIPSTIDGITYDPNQLDIDFTTLKETETNEELKQMAAYFETAGATYQNEYTGMFKGKNLIFILAESFNEVAVDEIRTPTLYKLIHEGFDFTNFYSPKFLSTTGGEFQAMTGLIPTQEILDIWKQKTPNFSYALGNAFGELGYQTQAYHNWTYTYYNRHKTMPTLGFANYLGCGNGIEKQITCKWLSSDIEMINKTAPLYMSEEKFVTYYVTVSGHSPYVKGANIVNTYYSEVKDLPISTGIKSYLASQIELDRALEALLQQLEMSGKLEDTVIALVGDHYPYTLSIDEINEASSYEKDEIVEVNHSNFIIWNSEMEPVTIEKTASQIDVLPTLLNLFGIPYDSRLLIGKDILSTYEGIAIFSDRSWVTEEGTYFATSKQFVPKEGKVEDPTYIDRINRRVANAFTMSKLIVEYDYYTRIKNGSF